MSYLELDDRILEHPKFIRAVNLAGSEAVHLWLGLRAYCGQNLTDGFIPRDMIDECRGPKDRRKRAAALAALHTVGLLEEAEGGVQMHNFLKWSKSRADILAAKAAAKERKDRWKRNHSGDASGMPPERPPERVPNADRNGGGTREGTSPRVRAPAGALHSSPLLSTPDQIQPEAVDPKDLAGSAPAEAPKPEPAAAPAAASTPASVADWVRPRTLEQALTLPVCARAQVVADGEREGLGDWLQAERWPEVQRLAEVLEECTGQRRPLAKYSRDGGVRAIVALYAAGFMPGDLERALRIVTKEPWWTRDGATRGLQSLSPEVVSRALSKAAVPRTLSPELAALVAKHKPTENPDAR